MAIKFIDDIEISTVLETLSRRDISLWILPGATVDDLNKLLSLPWINIWNASEIDIEMLWTEQNPDRSILKVTRPEQDHITFRVTEFVRIYELKTISLDDRRHQRIIDRLKDKVEEITGLLCFIGDCNEHCNDVLLARDLTPSSTILIIHDDVEKLSSELSQEIYSWRKDVGDFVSSCKAITNNAGDPTIANLKDARGMKVSPGLLEDISPYWTFLSNSLTTPPAKIDQEIFDSFLNGDEAWPAYAAGIPYHRNATYFKDNKGDSGNKKVDLIEEIMTVATDLEHMSSSPNDQLKQVIIFCETGSGITTLLRQTAMKLALQGYPCLITKAFPKNFGGRSLENFIIEIQDCWLQQRKGKGSGSGMIPVCLFVDKDSEKAFVEHGLPKALQSLGRKILLVRAAERSEDEINAAIGVYTLPAEVDSEELISLGNQPLLYLSLYFKANRDRYYDLLQSVRLESGWESWLEFFLEGVLETSEQAVATAQRIQRLFEQDRLRIAQLGRVSGSVLRLHQYLQNRPLVTIQKAADDTGLTRPTVATSLRLLENLGMVRELTGRERHRLFVYSDYLTILNEGAIPLG